MTSYRHKQALADRIRKLREAKGWSQRELDRRAGVAQKTVSNIESPTSPVGSPRLDTVERIAEALGVELWQLLMPDDEVIVPADKARHLLKRYGMASDEGRKHIDRTAELEAIHKESAA